MSRDEPLPARPLRLAIVFRGYERPYRHPAADESTTIHNRHVSRPTLFASAPQTHSV